MRCWQIVQGGIKLGHKTDHVLENLILEEVQVCLHVVYMLLYWLITVWPTMWRSAKPCLSHTFNHFHTPYNQVVYIIIYVCRHISSNTLHYQTWYWTQATWVRTPFPKHLVIQNCYLLLLNMLQKAWHYWFLESRLYVRKTVYFLH